MDSLFFKVFKNDILRKLIFKFISNYNKNNKLIGFNYYNFNLLLILKSKNQSMLIEKLNNYNKYINSNSNNSSIKNLKYYLNFNSECLKELFKWIDLNIDLFKFVINTFLNEILKFKEIISNQVKSNKRIPYQYRRDRDMIQVIEPPLYEILIKNGNFEKFQFLLSINLIDINSISICRFIQYSKKFNSYINPYKIQQSIFISNKDIETTNSFIQLFKSFNIKFNNESNIINQLIQITLCGKSEIYGELLVELLPIKLKNKFNSFNHHVHYSSSGVENEKTMGHLFSVLLLKSDFYLLKLLLNKYKSESGNIQLYGFNLSIDTLECFQILPSDLIKSSFLDLVIVLFKNLTYIYLNASNYRSTTSIYYPEIAIYLAENHLGFLKTFNFRLSKMCQIRLKQQNYNIIKKGILSILEKDNEISINEYQFVNDDEIINNVELTIPNSNYYFIDYLLLNDKIDLVYKYFKKSNFKVITTNHLLIQYAFLLGDEKLTQLLFENFINSNLYTIHSSPYHYSTCNYFRNLFELLIFSMENNLNEIFEKTLSKINKVFEYFKKSIVIDKSIYQWVFENPSIAYKWLSSSNILICNQDYNEIIKNVIQLLSTFNTTGGGGNDITYNLKKINFIIGELNFGNLNLNSFNLSFLDFTKILIKNGILLQNELNCNSICKIFKMLIHLVRIGDNEIKLSSIVEILFKLFSNFSDTLISIPFIIESLIFIIVKCKSTLLIDLILSRNQFTKLFSNHTNNTYFNQIHYLIFKYSNLKNDSIILYLLNENYKYIPSDQSLLFTDDDDHSSISNQHNDNHFKFLENVGLNSIFNNNQNQIIEITNKIQNKLKF